jgi:hypothetical protein
MSMNHSTKAIKVDKLRSSDNVNVRFSADNPLYGVKVDLYDLVTMKDQIRTVGRVLEPLSVEELDDGTYMVLRGNRRFRAVLQLLNDPNSSKELLDNIKELICDVYRKLTPDERSTLINDHGARKRLSKAEIIHAVWQLKAAGYSNSDIAVRQLYNLASFTGQERLLETLPQAEPARQQAINKWLNGALNGNILPMAGMPQRVKDAYIQTYLLEEKKLPDGVKPEFKIDTKRRRDLISARKVDQDALLWNVDTGGPTFNELIQKFIDEDTKGTAPDNNKTLGFKKLKELQDQYRSTLTRAAFSIAMSKPVDNMAAMDSEAARLEKIVGLLIHGMDNIKDDNLKGFAAAILHKSESQFKEYLTLIS